MNIQVKMNRAVIALTVGCLMLPQIGSSQESVDEKPNPAAMVGDLVVARPIGLVMTVAGTAAFIVSLPFTLLAGHAGEAAETLMIGPAETTFMRCLGCTNPGYTNKDRDRHRAMKDRDAAATQE
jgi:hypothetical protein